MNIVVLDADPAFGSLQPDGTRLAPVDDAPLRVHGELTVHQRTAPAEVLERAHEAEVILTNKVVLGEKEFASLPHLKLVSVLATGVNVIDVDAAKRHGVTVCNVPGYSTACTAQHAFALLLELCSRVGAHDDSVSDGNWSASPAFSYFRTPLLELDGLTLGIVGYGAIGQRMAQLGRAVGMNVLAHTRTERDLPDVTYVNRSELLSNSDIVSLHCPLTEETKHFINAESLAQMKPSSLLINVSRGPVVDEPALAAALEQGTIRGAATDVLSQEPPAADNPLVLSKKCIVTPHIAWASVAARRRLIEISAENVRLFLKGEPQYVVAKP